MEEEGFLGPTSTLGIWWIMNWDGDGDGNGDGWRSWVGVGWGASL